MISPSEESIQPGFKAVIYFLTFFVWFGLATLMKLKLARSFGKGPAFLFAMIFMEDLMFLLLGLDKSSYYGRTLRIYNEPEEAGPKRPRRKRNYLIKLTKRRSWTALVSGVIVTLCTFYAVSLGLISQPSLATPERGQTLFRLFTVNSNTLSAFGAALLIPYAIEGIRNKRFAVPFWLTMFQYSGTICTTLTMAFAFAFILPAKGAATAFTGMNFWLHLLCPIMALVLLFSTESRLHITVEDSMKALIPFCLYALIYIFNVVLVGENMGGWRDIYWLTKFLPAEFSGPLMFMLGFGIASLIRLVCNHLNEQREEKMKKIWKSDMSPVEAKIEVYGIGRYIGLRSPDTDVSIPMEILEDVSEIINIPMEELITVCSRGIRDGRRDLKNRPKRRLSWYDKWIGIPERKANADTVS